MSMIEQYPARPECVYGTPEFYARRNAKMAAMRKPVRRVGADAVEPAPEGWNARAFRDKMFPPKSSVVLMPGRVVAKPSKSKHVRIHAEAQLPPELECFPVALPLPAPVQRDWVIVGSGIRVNDILILAAAHYGLSVMDLISHRRTSNIVLPRQVVMYLARTLTPRSLPEIGRRIGGRDHTTVMHAVSRVGSLLKRDDKVASDVATLTAAVMARVAA